MSVLQLAQEDLVSGDYEGQVGEAVDQLMTTLEQPPRVIQVLVNCVDDFVGTDGETLVEGLRERFPAVRFSLSCINPIAVDVSADFAGKMHAGLYGLLEQPASRDVCVALRALLAGSSFRSTLRISVEIMRRLRRTDHWQVVSNRFGRALSAIAG